MLRDLPHEPSSDSDNYRSLSSSHITMTKLTCPDTSCKWESQDFPPEFAVAANTVLELRAKLAHAPNQPTPQAPTNSAIKLKPPQISSGAHQINGQLSKGNGLCIRQECPSSLPCTALSSSTVVMVTS